MPNTRPKCSECSKDTYHRSGKCKPCRRNNDPKGSNPMTKILTTLCLLLALSACGPHYEYFSGDRGPAGKDGSDGKDGSTGAQGPQGTPGIDATSVTVVKLCPGVTVYPSKFTEVAFCIQSKLYAVYSANGGFESEIPVGYYSSNGINSSCNFTVGPNCSITY